MAGIYDRCIIRTCYRNGLNGYFNMVEVFEREVFSEERCKEPWKFINEQINRSKIKRYNWKAVYGSTLTRAILTLKMNHISKDQAVSELINHERMKSIFMADPSLFEDMAKNIKISVYARFGENNSSTRLYMQVKNHNKKNENTKTIDN